MTESTLFFTCFSLPGFATMPVSVLCNHLWASCAYFLMAPPFAPFLTALFGVAAPFLTALFGVALDAGLGLLLRVPRVFTIAGLERGRGCVGPRHRFLKEARGARSFFSSAAWLFWKVRERERKGR